MDNFRKLFEAFNEESTPEEMLELAIELKITNFVDATGDEYWFDEKISYSGSDIVKWLEEHYHDFYIKVLKVPDKLEATVEPIEALQALGLMKEWTEIDYDDVHTPEDIERWKRAREEPEDD